MLTLSCSGSGVKPRNRICKPAVLTSCSCTLRPIYPCDLLPVGNVGVISINGTSYDLLPLGQTTRDGYRLTNHDNGKVYDVDTNTGYPCCDCPDFTFRRGSSKTDRCKHGLALVQLRKDGVI